MWIIQNANAKITQSYDLEQAAWEEMKWGESSGCDDTLKLKKHILIQHNLLAVAEIYKFKELLSCLVLP